MLIYCSECLYPSTKPDLNFINGVCSACINFKNRGIIDWNQRKNEFINLFNKYKSDNNWDCIIPVSGGKDSTYQIYNILELGYNPLCVISSTCHLSDIGRKNIENIKNMDIDDSAFKGIEAIILSMTPEERSKPEVLNGSRRQRIAKGSGQGVQEVNKLMKQFEETRKMMRMMGDKNQMAKLMKNMPGGMPKM